MFILSIVGVPAVVCCEAVSNMARELCTPAYHNWSRSTIFCSGRVVQAVETSDGDRHGRSADGNGAKDGEQLANISASDEGATGQGSGGDGTVENDLRDFENDVVADLENAMDADAEWEVQEGIDWAKIAANKKATVNNDRAEGNKVRKGFLRGSDVDAGKAGWHARGGRGFEVDGIKDIEVPKAFQVFGGIEDRSDEYSDGTVEEDEDPDMADDKREGHVEGASHRSSSSQTGSTEDSKEFPKDGDLNGSSTATRQSNSSGEYSSKDGDSNASSSATMPSDRPDESSKDGDRDSSASSSATRPSENSEESSSKDADIDASSSATRPSESTEENFEDPSSEAEEHDPELHAPNAGGQDAPGVSVKGAVSDEKAALSAADVARVLEEDGAGKVQGDGGADAVAAEKKLLGDGKAKAVQDEGAADAENDASKAEREDFLRKMADHNEGPLTSLVETAEAKAQEEFGKLAQPAAHEESERAAVVADGDGDVGAEHAAAAAEDQVTLDGEEGEFDADGKFDTNGRDGGVTSGIDEPAAGASDLDAGFDSSDEGGISSSGGGRRRSANKRPASGSGGERYGHDDKSSMGGPGGPGGLRGGGRSRFSERSAARRPVKADSVDDFSAGAARGAATERSSSDSESSGFDVSVPSSKRRPSSAGGRPSSGGGRGDRGDRGDNGADWWGVGRAQHERKKSDVSADDAVYASSTEESTSDSSRDERNAAPRRPGVSRRR